MWRKAWKWIEGIGIVLGLIAAALVIWSSIENRFAKNSLTTEISQVDGLTIFKKVPNLIGNFTYKGAAVDRLWRICLIATNTGKQTLVGKGPNKNLLSETISYSFPTGVNVLNVNVERNDPKITEPKLEGNTFLIEFEQWKPQETLTMTVFVKTDKGFKGNPARGLFYTNDRSIPAGDMHIEMRPGVCGEERSKQPIITTFPPTVELIIEILLLVLNGIIGLGFIGLFIASIFDIKSMKRMKEWKSNYGSRYRKHLEELASDNKIWELSL